MYEITKNVITGGRYELSGMLRRLDVIWLQGDLTDEQHTELVELARSHADPAMTATLTRRMEAVEARLDALEQAGAESPDAPAEEWPAYVVGRSYRTGDQVTFEGRHYICRLPVHVDQCVWSPADYPSYWKEA